MKRSFINSYWKCSRASLVMFAILLLALALRLHNLTRYPLWFDEAAAAIEPRSVFSLPPVGAFFDPHFAENRSDYLMFYYHGVVYFWRMLFGDSVFFLRISSIIWALLGVGMVYKLAAYLYDRNIALVSALLLALSPFHMYYSQELRQYTAVMFLSLVSFYLVFKIMEHDRPKDWFFWITVNCVNIYFHYMMLTVWTAEVLVLLLFRRRIRHVLLKIGGGSLLLLSLIAPAGIIIIQKVLYIMTHTVRADISEFPLWGGTIDFLSVLYSLRNFSAGYTVDFYSFQGWGTTVVLAVLFVFGMARGWRRRGGSPGAVPREAIVLILFIFPIAALFILSQLVKTCYVDRYFFPLGALYCMGISVGICSAQRLIRFLLLACVCVSLGFGLASYYRDDMPLDNTQHIGYMKKDTHIDEITAAIAANYRPGDVIISATKLITAPLKYYTRVYVRDHIWSARSALLAEANAGKMLWIDNDDKPYLLSYNKIIPVWFDKRPFAGREEADRVWLIHYRFDYRYEVFLEMKKWYAQVSKFRFGNAEIYLYVKR